MRECLLQRLLAATPPTEFFSQNAPHLRRGNWSVCLRHMSGKRIVDQRLVPLAGALGQPTEVANNGVIQKDRDARFTVFGGNRTAAPARKINASLHSPYAPVVSALELLQ